MAALGDPALHAKQALEQSVLDVLLPLDAGRTGVLSSIALGAGLAPLAESLAQVPGELRHDRHPVAGCLEPDERVGAHENSGLAL